MTRQSSLNDREHWQAFYSSWTLAVPSQFCSMVALDLKPGDAVVEFGCGNGRDAVSFNLYGARVLGVDASAQAIEQARALAAANPRNDLDLLLEDVANTEALVQAVADWSTRTAPGRTLFYSRFFLHSIDEAREKRVLDAWDRLFRPGDLGYLEFRVVADATISKVFGQHYRRYIDLPVLAAKLEARGFEVRYAIEGQGMARFRDEDAFVGRLIFGR